MLRDIPITVGLGQVIITAVLVTVSIGGFILGLYAKLGAKIDDFASRMSEQLHDLEMDFSKYKTYVAETYMRRDSAIEAVDRLAIMVERHHTDATNGRHNLRNEIHVLIDKIDGEHADSLRELRTMLAEAVKRH